MSIKMYCVLMGLAFAQEEEFDMTANLEDCELEDGYCADQFTACTEDNADLTNDYGCVEAYDDVWSDIIDDFAETDANSVNYDNCFIDNVVDEETAKACIAEARDDYMDFTYDDNDDHDQNLADLLDCISECLFASSSKLATLQVLMTLV